MPILNLKVSAVKSAELSKSISGILLELTARILKKETGLISIAIDYVDPDDWIVGGPSRENAASISISRLPTRPTPKLKRPNTFVRRLTPSASCSATSTK
jgi:phenylpyruvate tautomerase PptA (4-oxalocrotonate tautomerase family)